MKKEIKYIDEYINLRNNYVDLLLTHPVNKKDTLNWLCKENIEIIGIVNDEILLGVVILYLNKAGEITVFVKDKSKGIGTKLLSIIEDIARKKNLPFIWAWVLKKNAIARRLFEKRGFLNEGEQLKEHNGILYEGIKYRKILID